MTAQNLFAAIDLGSNSFRLEIGNFSHHHFQRVEYLKETVRQGGGLDADRYLSEEAMQRGWDCLARFGERLAGFPATQVRAVATQTLREARNREAFVRRGAELLGYPIEIIGGEEEARLIYRGVSSLLPASDERRLVIDIGGRSTELVLGRQQETQQALSLRLGSVAWSQRYFPKGELSRAAFSLAAVAARAVLDEALDTLHAGDWDAVYASSGTAAAIGDILAANGRTSGVIDAEGLEWLHDCLVRAQTTDQIRLAGLKEERRAVIAGGVSIMQALFDLLQLRSLQVAEGALRQGVLYTLVEQAPPCTDLRSAAVQGLMQKFCVDTGQAQRVAGVARNLLEQLAPHTAPEHHEALRHAALLHEIGSHIAHSNYHRHGAYVLQNTSAAGFTQAERGLLAQLVCGQRGKLRKLEPEMLTEPQRVHSLLALRLAVLLCHARRPPELASLRIAAEGQRFRLSASSAWSQAYPQSAFLLQEEQQAWLRTSWQLDLDWQ
ncbi:Ppx/GppA phosphatase family protein [Comamonas endophytica]|uniref:Ppx/GppA family phosphatase n=1 Tax=Comamonas endophytica TaxID=2949090 RepID=A0ABY6GBS9_9BURK|nr:MULTISPECIES: Ppx/GppA phosphatase family protein [unclassified Acidovorax]MCD2513829.1 Ppx/GppA family phosphatase [Acidovorax sp. D4N7]UYG52170.1 Ppx/GppA family phosphatase [Acidovorax sp. 5MLIR]